MYALSATSFPKIFSVNFWFFSGVRSSVLAGINCHWTISPRSLIIRCSLKPKPPHSPFASCDKSPKGFVSSRSLVVTHPNGGGVNDRDAGAIAQTTVVEKQIKFERNHLLTFHKAIVREHGGKVLSPLFADHLGVESLECSVAREVKEDENGDNFAVAHLKSAISPLFPSSPIAFFLNCGSICLQNSSTE